MSEFVSNRARLAQNGRNLGLFKISFLFILAPCAKMNRKLILKSPRFVQFGANLNYFVSKSDITVTCSLLDRNLAQLTASDHLQQLARRFDTEMASQQKAGPVLSAVKWSLFVIVQRQIGA